MIPKTRVLVLVQDGSSLGEGSLQTTLTCFQTLLLTLFPTLFSTLFSTLFPTLSPTYSQHSFLTMTYGNNRKPQLIRLTVELIYTYIHVYMYIHIYIHIYIYAMTFPAGSTGQKPAFTLLKNNCEPLPSTPPVSGANWFSSLMLQNKWRGSTGTSVKFLSFFRSFGVQTSGETLQSRDLTTTKKHIFNDLIMQRVGLVTKHQDFTKKKLRDVAAASHGWRSLSLGSVEILLTSHGKCVNGLVLLGKSSPEDLSFAYHRIGWGKSYEMFFHNNSRKKPDSNC